MGAGFEIAFFLNVSVGVCVVIAGYLLFAAACPHMVYWDAVRSSNPKTEINGTNSFRCVMYLLTSGRNHRCSFGVAESDPVVLHLMAGFCQKTNISKKRSKEKIPFFGKA